MDDRPAGQLGAEAGRCLCGAILTFAETAKKQPAVDSSSAEAAVTGIVSYLDGFEGNIDTAVAALKAAGPSPVAGGDEMVTRFTQAFGSIRATMDTVKTSVAKVDPQDGAALQNAIAPMNALDAQLASLDKVEGGPELDAAAANAPNCQKLEAAA